MKAYIWSLLVLLLMGSINVWAQGDDDAVIFKAMEDEMNRGMKELKQADSKPICCIGVNAVYGRTFMVRGILGGIIQSDIIPVSYGSVNVLAGDYNFTSQIKYPNELERHQLFSLPVVPDYDQIRRGIWGAMDATYKNAQKQIYRKQAYFDNIIIPEEEKKIIPFPKIEPVSRIVEPRDEYSIDQAYWENYIKELSGIFKNYKDVIFSSIYVMGKDLEIYQMNTEGIKVKQPVRFVYLFCNASIRDAEGVSSNYQLTESAICPQDMPSLDEMKKKVTDMAETLVKMKNAPKFEGDYTGPILYLDDACQTFLLGGDLFGVSSRYVAARKTEDPGLYSQYKPTLENKIGQSVTHTALTVKNYSSMYDYKGFKLMGAYEVDAEGIIPEKEMTLIEKGVLKQPLSSRTRSVYTEKSTGSMRWTGNGSSIVCPGTLHVSADKGYSQEELKKMLIKEAKKQKLNCAYIVRGNSGAYFEEIYRVNLKTGEETLVFAAQTPRESWGWMGSAMAFSEEEGIVNIPAFELPVSLIYPNGVLFKKAKISEIKEKEKPMILTRPLDR